MATIIRTMLESCLIAINWLHNILNMIILNLSFLLGNSTTECVPAKQSINNKMDEPPTEKEDPIKIESCIIKH